MLAAQQAGAKAAEEAARSSERLVSERAGGEGERTALGDEIEELRVAGAAASERATSAHDALEAALAAHRATMDERDHMAARAAAAHEQEATRLAEQLDQSGTTASAAQARAEAADHRAASAEEFARKAAKHAAETEASMSRLHVDFTEAAVDSANQRSASAERLLGQGRWRISSPNVSATTPACPSPRAARSAHCPKPTGARNLSVSTPEGVQASGEALLGLINDVLDLSKIEAGKLEIEMVDFDLVQAGLRPRPGLDDVVALVAEPARAKGLELVVHCPPHLPATVSGDVGRLRQVLLNLLSNAINITYGAVVGFTSRCAASQ